MTGYRSRVMVIGLVGSLVVHGCVFAVLASLDWSVSSWLPMALRSDNVADARGRGFDADIASGRAEGQSQRGATAGAVQSRASSGPATALAISAETVAREVVMPVARGATWSAPRIAAHLWESTVIAALIGALTLLLRRSGAHLRYWLWLAASMKFFVPFSAVAALASEVASLMPARAVTASTIATGMVEFVQRPYAIVTWAPPIVPPLVASTLDWLVFGTVSAWLLGAVALAVMRYRMWRRVRTAVQVSTPVMLPYIDLPSGVQLRSAPSVLEPGVVGWRRPVLLLPAGIESCLTMAELQAVIAHEVCHIRRRDNLTAALHMLTEIVFWFFPVVWWIGGRLLNERERACDEAVVAGGNEPATYAQAIVNVCATYAASPVACIAGVTSSDLRKRIETIVQNERPLPLVGWRMATVALTVAAALVLPIAYGVLHASPRWDRVALRQPSQAPSAQPAAFEAASIKVNTSGLPQANDRIQGGRYTATNMPLLVLIRFAYEKSPRSKGLEPFEVTGGPGWLLTDRFDVSATAGRDVSLTEMRSMLRTLLAERFQVAAHVERRPGHVYRMSLVRPGRLSPQLRRAEADCTAVAVDPFRGVKPGEKAMCGFFGPSPTAPIESDRAYQAMRGLTMEDFATALYPHLGRRVIDDTGLNGFFDADLEFTAEIMMPPPPSGPNPFDGRTLPSIFSVLPQQLGLKLQPAEAPVDILVIDRAAHPTEN